MAPGSIQDFTQTLYFNFTANEYLPIMPKYQADLIGNALVVKGRWKQTDNIQALDLTQLQQIIQSPLYKSASMITP